MTGDTLRHQLTLHADTRRLQLLQGKPGLILGQINVQLSSDIQAYRGRQHIIQGCIYLQGGKQKVLFFQIRQQFALQAERHSGTAGLRQAGLQQHSYRLLCLHVGQLQFADIDADVRSVITGCITIMDSGVQHPNQRNGNLRQGAGGLFRSGL